MLVTHQAMAFQCSSLCLHFSSCTRRGSLITQILFKHRPWLKSHWKVCSRHTAVDVISTHLWNPEFHYCGHKPVTGVYSEARNWIHSLTPYFLKCHCNIHLFMPRSYKWPLPFKFSNYNYMCIFCLSSSYLPRPFRMLTLWHGYLLKILHNPVQYIFLQPHLPKVQNTLVSYSLILS